MHSFQLLLAVLSAQVVYVQSGACDTDSTGAFNYQGIVNSGDYTELTALGVGKTVTVTCVEMIEGKADLAGCTLRSVLHVCRGSVNDRTSCQALSEFIYSTTGDVTFGSAEGEEYTWLLAFDGRGKGQECYQRTLDISMIVSVSTPEEGSSSLALSVIAVIVVVLVVLCIVMVLCIFFHKKTQQNRATHVPEHQMTVADGNAPPTLQTTTAIPVVQGVPQQGSYYGNPIDRTFDEKNPEGYGYAKGYDAYPNNGYGNDGHVAMQMYQVPPPSGAVPVYTPEERDPSPLQDPSVMALACADCGQQIGHPGTLAVCPLTSKVHPPKVMT